MLICIGRNAKFDGVWDIDLTISFVDECLANLILSDKVTCRWSKQYLDI